MSEPTSKLNDLSSETVTKLVSIIVAIVVFAVVLVPIVNGLADGNGDGGDGGSGGEGERVILNTEGLSPFYSSIQIYPSSITPTLSSELTYTLTDLEEIKQRFSGATDVFSTILNATNYSTPESDTRLQIYYEDAHNDIFIQIRDPSISGLEKVTQLNEVTSFNLTISPNYMLSVEYTTSTNETFSIEVPVTQIYLLSNAEYGWWMTDYSSYGKISVGSQLLFEGFMEAGDEKYISVTLTENMFSENHLSFTIDWGDGETSDIELEIQSTDTEGIWQLTGNDWGDRYSVKDNQGNEYANADAGLYAITNYYSLPSSDSESGSGSSSDSSGISGTAGTILKIIPVLVGVGVILAIVALFYDPRNLINKD